ncbi:MAG: hypothetical protein ABJG78_14890 [Cyclobacteriaceae bacterium]
MRLGQLARKYDVSLQEVISYLNEVEPDHKELHSNSKLTEETEALISKRFELLFDEESEDLELLIEETPKEEIQETPATELVEEEPEAPEIMEEDEASAEVGQTSTGLEISDAEEMVYLMQDVEEPAPKHEVEVPVSEPEAQDQEREEAETIETDRLLELLESEEESIDLSKITLIKAPKKELDGLKVVGKIEIAEPKAEVAEKNEDQPTKPKFDSEILALRQQQREELREQRRLIAKKKEEEHKARQEKRAKDREKKKVKAQKEAHYKSKLKQNPSKRVKPKAKNQAQQHRPSTEVIDQRPKPKTLLGKFWRWLNT